MRLIDANELYEKTAEWEAKALHAVEITMNYEDKTEWRKWSAVLCERSAFKFDVADAPTVEAIPIEWIREYTEENRLYQSDDFDLYIHDMIADWAERKEE